MRRVKIKCPTLVSLGLAILVLSSASIMGLYQLQRQHIHETVRASVARVQDLFQTELEEEAELISGLIEVIKRDEDLQKAWLARDRDALFGHSAPLFEDVRSKCRVTHFYFHDLDKVCFLRVHNPPRYGDYIKRFTLDGAVRDTKPVHGIELGPYGTFTLRVVYPWKIGDELVGYIELGEEIEHIIPKLKEITDTELVFILDKSYLNRADWEEGLKMIGRKGDWDQFPNFVIVGQTMNQVFPELNEYLKRLISCSEVEHFRHIVKMSSGDRTYQGAFIPLLDVRGRDVGDIMVINDITSKEAALRTQLIILIVICAVTAMVLFVFFYAYLGHIARRLVEARETMMTKIEEQKKAELQLREDDEKLQKEMVQRNNAEARLEKQVVKLEQAREAALNIMEDLEREVTERKKAEQELTEKMKELEEFNQLAVDREMKMIKLKEEINQLLVESGTEARYEIVK